MKNLLLRCWNHIWYHYNKLDVFPHQCLALKNLFVQYVPNALLYGGARCFSNTNVYPTKLLNTLFQPHRLLMKEHIICMEVYHRLQIPRFFQAHSAAQRKFQLCTYEGLANQQTWIMYVYWGRVQNAAELWTGRKPRPCVHSTRCLLNTLHYFN